MIDRQLPKPEHNGNMLISAKDINMLHIPYHFVMASWNSRWRLPESQRNELLDRHPNFTKEYWNLWEVIKAESVYYAENGDRYKLWEDYQGNLHASLLIFTPDKIVESCHKHDSQGRPGRPE